MLKLTLSRISFACSLLMVSALAFLPVAQAVDAAKSGQTGWFVPKAQQEHPAPAVHKASSASRDETDDASDVPQSLPILPLPLVPVVPPLAKEAAPPQAVIGIISVQGVMMLSTAAQEIQQVLGSRRDRLAREVQKEEAAWRAEQQKLQVEARMLTADQIQIRERHLQERRAKDQHDFGNQARIIQEAYQVAFHQIERELEQRDGIIANVAGAHGMNLVLHAEQAVLHVEGQDITEEVASQLNKLLPHVFIPDDGVDPEVLAKSGKMPTTADEDRLMNQAPASQKVDRPVNSVLRQK